MKNSRLFLFAFFTLVFVLNLPAVAQTSSKAANLQLASWKIFSPAEKNFKVSLPVEPERTLLPTAFEDVESIVHKSVTKFAMFQVISTDLPADIEEDDLKKFWDSAISLGLNDVEKKQGAFIVRSRKDVSRGSILGREVIIENGTVSSRMQFFLVKKRFYVVEMSKPDFQNMPKELAEIYQAESDKFFNSFQIVDNKPQQVARGAGNKQKQ
jgi:hypothetical protein